jgi:hypothetical protein
MTTFKELMNESGAMTLGGKQYNVSSPDTFIIDLVKIFDEHYNDRTLQGPLLYHQGRLNGRRYDVIVAGQNWAHRNMNNPGWVDKLQRFPSNWWRGASASVNWYGLLQDYIQTLIYWFEHN